jgi:hypothetical protein
MVQVDAGTNDLLELSEGVRVRGDVAGNDVGRAWNQGAKVLNSAQARSPSLSFPAGGFGLRSRGVASIAIDCDVYEVTPEADQRRVLVIHVKGHWGGGKLQADAGSKGRAK